MSDCPARSQKGMVLLLCLMFLAALTLLGLSASADTILQNQLASNLQDTERAKQSAQTALKWAEKWLSSLDGLAPETCTGECAGFKVHAAGNLVLPPGYTDLAWWQTHGFEAGINPLTGDRLDVISASSIDRPMWLIESLHEIPASSENSTDHQVWYRLVARGSGRSGNAISVVESIVTRTWSPPVNNNADEASGTGTGRVAWREIR